MQKKSNFVKAVLFASQAVGLECPISTRKLSPKEKAEYKQKAIERAKARKRKAEIQSVKLARQAYIIAHRQKMFSGYPTDNWRANISAEHFMGGEYLVSDSTALILGLFYDAEHIEDIIWCGQENDTGKAKHSKNFRTPRIWADRIEKEYSRPPRISPSTFKCNAISRSKKHIVNRPYICLEVDDGIGKKPETDEERELNKAINYQLIQFVKHELGLTLRAVIDTSGKSLHSWWDTPPKEDLEILEEIALGLGVDKACLSNLVAPLRLPGCHHDTTHKKARLLMLNPKYPEQITNYKHEK